MSNNYTETELQLIINKITSAQASSITMNEGELYLAPDTAVYSVNNVTPTNGNVSIPEGANKDLSNLSSTGNAKFQAPITGGASTITSSNLTTNRALVSNSSGKVAVSSVTLSELGYVSGVTSNIQTQLNNKVVSVNNIQPVNGNVTIDTGFSRNIGEIVQSTIPLTDAGLHLLDGALISGSGSYSAFVDYIADLYNSSAKTSNVTKVGSLTDNNGVLSDFSASNYATLPQVFNPASNTWEQVWCFTTGSSVTTVQSIIGGVSGFANPLYRITNNGYIQMLCSTNNSSWDIGITGNSTLTANTKYYIKGSFNGAEYKLELSTDGESFTTVGVVSNTSSIYIVDKQKLGNNNASNETFLGSIDLKESYININGQRWWSGTNPYWAMDESAWQSSISTYGVCGKFVYDSVNNTVRLPKITGFTEGTIDPTTLGNLVEAGLPNITGKTMTGGVSNYHNSLDIYGNSSTVQPQSIKVLYYIVVATSTKTDIEVDIDEIATDLNGKADVDLANVNNAGTSRGAGWAMPSDAYINLTLGASGTTYTAPANGWFVLSCNVSQNAYSIVFITQSNGFNSANSRGWLGANTNIPVKKGDVVQLMYDGISSVQIFRFIYAVGSESEAS